MKVGLYLATQFTPETDMRLQLDNIIAQVRTARLNKEIARIGLNNTRQTTTFEGVNAYVDVLRQKRLIELARENEATIQRQANLENERVQRGSGVAVDVLQAKSRLQVSKERRVTFEGALRFAKGTHRENTQFRKRFLVRGSRVADIPNIPAPDEEVEPETVAAPAVSLLVFDTDGFHSAGTLAPGQERKSLTSTSYPSRLSPVLRPRWYSPQGLRESRLNPLRAFAPHAPAGRVQTHGRIIRD